MIFDYIKSNTVAQRHPIAKEELWKYFDHRKTLGKRDELTNWKQTGRSMLNIKGFILKKIIVLLFLFISVNIFSMLILRDKTYR